jgi:hypothetical protein
MHQTESTDNRNALLTQKIIELETVLGRQLTAAPEKYNPTVSKTSTMGLFTVIPVLDDLVTDEEMGKSESSLKQVLISKVNSEELTKKLERRFSNELDEVLNKFREDLKNNIIQSLSEAKLMPFECNQ